MQNEDNNHVKAKFIERLFISAGDPDPAKAVEFKSTFALRAGKIYQIDEITRPVPISVPVILDDEADDLATVSSNP